MTKAEYFEYVCESNELESNLVYLENDETPLYIDRHVGDPPMNWPPEVAIEAGFLLLRQWHNKAQSLAISLPLVYEGPVLFVDDSWMNSLESAPPPHVQIFLAKKDGVICGTTDNFADAVVVTAERCPFSSLVLKYVGDTEVVYLPGEDNIAAGEECISGGVWCIPPVKARYVERKFFPF